MHKIWTWTRRAQISLKLRLLSSRIYCCMKFSTRWTWTTFWINRTVSCLRLKRKWRLNCITKSGLNWTNLKKLLKHWDKNSLMMQLITKMSPYMLMIRKLQNKLLIFKKIPTHVWKQVLPNVSQLVVEIIGMKERLQESCSISWTLRSTTVWMREMPIISS